MSEPSKFSGALAKLNQSPPKMPEEQSTPLVSEPVVKRGRATGKRSNPDYEPTTVLLRKQTKKKAHRKLEDEETGQDLSDLIEKLLSEWVNS